MTLTPSSSHGSGPANVSASTVIQTGNASPVGSVVPTHTGALYQDLTNGALYQAVGATNADWVSVGGNGAETVGGVVVTTHAGTALVAKSPNGTVQLTDVAGLAGTGNGLVYEGNASDGAQDLHLFLGSTGQYEWDWNADGSFKLARGIKTGQQTIGALPTVALVSGTAAQIDTVSDRETHTAVTFNPGVATTATCTVALSPDNTTFSTLCVVTKPVGTVFDGEIEDVVVRVPAGWYLKLTVVNATLGTTTYY